MIAPKIDPDTYSRGFNYHLFRDKGQLNYLTLYAQQSTTFGANSVNFLPNRERSPNTTGDTINYGVKFGALENRISGVFTIFDVSLEDEAAVNLQWSDFAMLAEAQGNSDFTGIDPSTTRDTRDLVSEGWEFQLNANITDNWRAMFSFDHYSTQYSNVAPATERIFEDYTSIFLADPDLIVNPDANDPQTAQEVYDRIFFQYLTEKAQEGRRTLNERSNKIVLVSSYDIHDTILGGFSFGGDVIWQDKALTGFGLAQLDNGTWVPNADNPFYSDDLVRVGAHVRYKTSLLDAKIDWTIQLNVRNIGGVDPYVVRDGAVASDPTTPIPWYTNRGLPTEYVLSNTFTW